MFGRYGRAGGLGEILAGTRFTNFNIAALREIATTGPTGRTCGGVPEIQAVLIRSIAGEVAFWNCEWCGGIEHLLAEEGRHSNPCPVAAAPPEIWLTLRERDAEAEPLGMFGW